MRILRFAALFTLPALSLLPFAACGGDDDGGGSATCGTFAAAGGDPTGSWALQDDCGATDNAGLDFCPTATIDDSNLTTTDNFSITSDMNFTDMVHYEGSAVIHLQQECLDANMAMCSDFNTTGVACTMGTTCDCTLTFTSADDQSISGTWATSANSITFTAGDGSGAFSADYTADGNELDLQIQGATDYLLYVK